MTTREPDWVADVATLESDLVEFDDGLAELGASPAVRAELCDQFRALGLTDPDDPDRVFLALRTLADFGKVLEAWLRVGGNDEQANVVGRSVSAITLWLELPDGLAHWVGRPVIG